MTTTHADNYWADQYTGVASVRGRDRRYDPKFGMYSFAWTRITYNVQGSYTSVTAYSRGNYDRTKRVKRVTVRDRWNFEPKTKAYYNFSLRWVSSVGPYLPASAPQKK